MSTHRLALHLSILLLASPATASFAQSTSCVDHLAAGTPCCGQYECIEDWSLTPASAYDAYLEVQAAHATVRLARTAPAEAGQDDPSLSAGDRRHD